MQQSLLIPSETLEDRYSSRVEASGALDRKAFFKRLKASVGRHKRRVYLLVFA